MTTTQSPGDAAIVCVYVAVAPEVAFDVFTRELNCWWRPGLAFRGYNVGELILEPRLGGRLLESCTSDSQMPILERGRVLVWEPPTRLAFTWRGGNFAPHESTRVDILFEQQEAGTCVTLRTAVGPGFDRITRRVTLPLESPPRT